MNKESGFRSKFPIVLYFVSIFSLFLYSFTQIDLSLTFSRIEFLQNIVRSFQYVGYFQRPLSAMIYLMLLLVLFTFYIYFLNLTFRKKLNKKLIWKLLVAASAILVLSYNAFSYDLFNYIFDAKIYTHYHLNPYLHKALDFPGDPMLSFMRWTHRVYPYGPVWLFLTIPLSYIGLNLFIPTFFLFKMMIGGAFLGSVYFIGKILQKIAPGKEIPGLVFFGLNPLLLIESLVSGHIDIVMMFFALFAIYMLLDKKYFFSLILLFLSVGIKFATVFLIPVFLSVIFLQKTKRHIHWDVVFLVCTILMSIAVILSSVYSGNFQPWYLILPLSVAVFSANKYYVLIPGIILSFFAMLTYVPYLYLGNWDKPVPQILATVNAVGVILSIAAVIILRIFLRKNYEK